MSLKHLLLSNKNQKKRQILKFILLETKLKPFDKQN